jgi:hypothetical protein
MGILLERRFNMDAKVREKITKDSLEKATRIVELQIPEVIELWEYDTLTSKHELLGLITEHYNNILTEFKYSDQDDMTNMMATMSSICLISIASMLQKDLDW